MPDPQSEWFFPTFVVFLLAWLMKHVAVYVKDFSRCLMFSGTLGKKILDTWAMERSTS